MLRRLILVPILLAVLMLLSGCHYVKGSLTVNEEGAFSGEVTVAIPKNTDPKQRAQIFSNIFNEEAKKYVKIEDWQNKTLIGKKYEFTDAPITTVFPNGEAFFTETNGAYVLELKASQDNLAVLKTAKIKKKKPKKIKYTPSWNISIVFPKELTEVSEGVTIAEDNPNKALISNEAFTSGETIRIVSGTIIEGDYDPADYVPAPAPRYQPPLPPQAPSNIPVVISWVLILGGLGLAVFGRKIDFVGAKRKKQVKQANKTPKKTKSKK